MAEPTSKTYVDSIKNHLTELAANIALSGRLNLTDIHLVSENFYAGLLNITYDWNLKNANFDHPNIEGFDLIDDNEKILVQVSATCKKTKIQHSLNEIDEAFQGYHFYFFPLITTKAESQKKQTYSLLHDVVFNPQNDIIEIVDLIRALQADTTGKRLEEAFHFVNDNLSKSIEERPLHTDYSKLKTHLSEQLRITREGHPSFRLMKINDDLFPKGLSELHNIEAVNDANEMKTVSAIVADSWDRQEKNHLMIEGEGGIGKTVTLLSLPDKFVPHKVSSVYVQLHRLKVMVEKGSNNNTSVSVETIENYIRSQVFFNDDVLFRQFEELTRIPWNKGPQVLLLLDGFNEIATEGRWAIGEDINRWAGRPGIQIITSSRFDIHSYVPHGSGYSKIQLQPLSRSIIKDYLDGLGISLPRTKSQWNIITYPLMLFLYAQTKDAMADENRDRRIQVYKASNSAGAIIWNYLQRELWRYRQNDADIVKCVLTAEFIAPFIAWKMHKDSVFTLSEERFNEYLDEAYERVSELDEKQLPPHIRRVLRHKHCVFPGCSDIQSFIEEEQLRLFIRNETTYSLMHQQFRDALAAMHLINVSYASDELPEEWKASVDYYVMQFVAELSTKEEADMVWEKNRKMKPSINAATINMLELQCRKRKYDFSELDFSGMDLRTISLLPYRPPKSSILHLPSNGCRNHELLLSPRSFLHVGHSSSVQVVILTPDGKRCVSGSSDNTLRIWDMASGQCLQTLEGHTGCIHALAINGNKCVSGSRDHTLRIWDMESGECLNTLKEHEDCINALAINGNKCVSGSSDNTLRIWDLESGRCLQTLKGHEGGIYTLAVNGNKCVSGSSDNTLRIWDLESGQCMQTLKGHEGGIYTLAINGNKCVSGSLESTPRIWDIKSGECLKTLEGHKSSILDLVITSDGGRCVSGSYDHNLRIWDMKSGEYLKTLEGHTGSIETVAVTLDGKRCVSGSRDHTLRIWDMESGECLKTLEGHIGSIETVAITPDGKRCVSGSSDNTLRIWDMESGECMKTLGVNKNDTRINVFAVISDRKQCVSESFGQTTLRLWDVDLRQCVKTMEGQDRIDFLSIPHYVGDIHRFSEGRIYLGWLGGDGSIRVLHASLVGVDLSQSIIDPPDFRDVLRQNGAIV